MCNLFGDRNVSRPPFELGFEDSLGPLGGFSFQKLRASWLNMGQIPRPALRLVSLFVCAARLSLGHRELGP